MLNHATNRTQTPWQYLKLKSNTSLPMFLIWEWQRFNFNVNLLYASFNADDELTIRKRDVQNSSKKYSGFHGSENSGNTVNINSDYGGVTLIKY